MKTGSNRSNAMFPVALVVIALWLCFITAWFVNGYKLIQCDFEAPYKGEIVHAIGLVPPLAVFTVWSDDK